MITGWRPGTSDDTPGVTDVYNYHISNSMAAYNEEPVDTSWASLFMKRAYAFYVFEAGHSVRGFASLNPFRKSSSFNGTATLTYFLMPDASGQGRGTQILRRLEADARQMGINQLLAHISSLNEQSLSFHHKRGFHECGRFRSIGIKHNNIFDLIWMQKSLDNALPIV
ncbi:N-acetyltransferase [bacterium]|nr:N-acetyltransferase [bacterium]